MKRGCGHGNGADADALIHHGDTVLFANLVTDGHQVSGQVGDFAADIILKSLWIVAGAIEKIDTQRNSTDIQVLVLEHFKGG